MMSEARTKELLKAVAENVRSRRKATGMTQEVLAEQAGLSVNYIARVERRLSVPSLKTLVRLADALGVCVAGLVTEDQTGEPVREMHGLEEALTGLDEANTEFAVQQFRSLTSHLRRQQKTAHSNTAGSE